MMKLFLLFLGISASSADKIKDFAAASEIFTGEVYSQLLLDNDDNFLVSPFSAETVFALTQSGAVGETGEEIRSALHLPKTREETEETIRLVLPTIQSDHISLITANKIYVQNSLPIKEDFQRVATDVYKADFQNVEFTQADEAASEINQWVQEETKDKIKDLVSADDFDATTKIVLVNALYFQANWSTPFDPYYTAKAKFFTSEEDSLESVFMFQESEQYNYFESEELDAQILEIPFQGGEAALVVVLPQKKEGIALLEKDIRRVLNVPKFEKKFVQVQLPKFKIESTVDFGAVLQKLGLQKAFNPSEADFSGIAGDKGELFITKATQKTYIDVNEIGVEAAAATEISGNDSLPPPASKVFTADHPFVFYIKVNDIVLFQGRVLVPKYE